MISLLTESYGNNIKTKGALELNSGIKRLTQGLINLRPDILEKVKNLDPGMEFKEYHTDLICVINDTYDNENILVEKGYEETDYYSFHSAAFNNVRAVNRPDYIYEKEDDFIDRIPITCSEEQKDLSYFLSDNFVIFYAEGETKAEYFYEFDDSVTVCDFKIDSSYFVHILYRDNSDDCLYYSRSHLSKPFMNLNKNKSEPFLKEFFCTVKLQETYSSAVIKISERDSITTIDENNCYTEYKLAKKYFFTNSGKIYFNKTEEEIFTEDDFIEDEVQLNNLNMYNYINFLGLNDYKIDGKRKLSTFENDLFLDIFKNKFDNTVNGGLNYFDSKFFYRNKRFKDYHVNISDENFSVSGNFIYEYKNGVYEILINKNECELIKIDGSSKESVKIIKIPDAQHFYFCNLKFIKKRYAYSSEPIVYRISAMDKYSFAIRKNEACKIDKMFNSPKETSKILNNAVVRTPKVINDIVYFDGRKIVFKNFYDFSEQKFKYGNREMNVYHSDKVPKTKAKLYFFKGSHFEKSGHIYFREQGVLNYSEDESFNFELVDLKGYITDFWIESQGSIVYFENKDGIVKLTKNVNDADFSCMIPLISDYISETKENFKNISVIDNDDLEVEVQYKDTILMTSKFMDIPLFYKFYLEEQINETFRLYDSSGIEILEYITEPYKEGYLIYFNAKKDERYYYALNEDEYNYVWHMKAYENLSESYRFDDSGIIEIDETYIKTFSLHSSVEKSLNSKYELFLHNSRTKEVNKIELSGSELNKNFDLEISADKIILKCDGASQDISFCIVDLQSIILDNRITFIKDSRYEQVFISEEKAAFPKDIDFSKIKVNTVYNVEGSVYESEGGTFSIEALAENEIPVLRNEKYNIYSGKSFAISIEEDNFYNENFKGIGIELISKVSEIKSMFETFNDSFVMGIGSLIPEEDDTAVVGKATVGKSIVGKN